MNTNILINFGFKSKKLDSSQAFRIMSRNLTKRHGKTFTVEGSTHAQFKIIYFVCYPRCIHIHLHLVYGDLTHYPISKVLKQFFEFMLKYYFNYEIVEFKYNFISDLDLSDHIEKRNALLKK